ncbi:unnamed protein product [Toxocara canis]|nr:unnamed protein product [Toxocara canis]
MRVLWTLFAVLLVSEGKGGRGGGRGSSRARFTSSGKTGGSARSGGSYTKGFSLLGSDAKASRSFSKFRSSLRSSMHSSALRTAGLIIITNPMTPYYYGGNYYYWSRSQYNGRDMKRSNVTKCELNIKETQELKEIYLDEKKTRPELVIWECKSGFYCCGVECCSVIDDR